MKLPNFEQAVVTQEKVIDYLLSDTHRDGRHKAVFFKRFGFTIQEWEGLASALREHAVEHDISHESKSRRMGNAISLKEAFALRTGRTLLSVAPGLSKRARICLAW
jgi:hypothetical protein